MPELSKEQKYIILALVGILISGLAYAVYSNFSKSADPEIIISAAEEVKSERIRPKAEFVIVHLSGAVKRPGVFKLEKGSRIIDSIKAAGGIAGDADLDKVNLAQELKDGAKIKIPFRLKTTPVADPGELPLSRTSNGMVNLNTSTAQDLTKVKGIGKSTAQRIIEYREKNGGFSKIEDLMKVKGIGKGKFEKIKSQVVL